MNKKKFNMDDAILKVYNKIAIWHNDDSSKEGLKVISQEIIEDVLKDALSGLEAQMGVGIESPEEVVEDKRKKRGWFGKS